MISKLLIGLHKKIVGKEPCILYRRLFKYNKGVKDGYRNNCPFCLNNKRTFFKYFDVIENKYPYTNTKEHLLVIPDRHIKGIGALNTEELIELQKILSVYMGQGYLLLGRQYGAHPESSVEHFHLHFIK